MRLKSGSDEWFGGQEGAILRLASTLTLVPHAAAKLGHNKKIFLLYMELETQGGMFRVLGLLFFPMTCAFWLFLTRADCNKNC